MRRATTREGGLALAMGMALGMIGCGGAPWKPVPMSSPLPSAPPPEAAQRSEARALGAPATPATSAPSAIHADLPRDLDGKLETTLACDTTCTLDERAATTPEVAVVSTTLPRPGSKLTIAKLAGDDVYGVVLRGAAKLRGTEDGSGRALDAWTAFHLPGGAAEVVAGGADTRLVLVRVRARREGAKPLASWKTRPGAVETRDLRGATDLAWGGGAMHARTAFEGEKQPASLGTLIASSTAPVSPHQHAGSTEILVMLRGDGDSVIGDGETATTKHAADGSVMVIPPGVTHAWKPSGKAPLVAVQLYAPPGPEQRFKELAKSAGAPPPR